MLYLIHQAMEVLGMTGRLTARNTHGAALLRNVDYSEFNGFSTVVQRTINKLADYEDAEEEEGRMVILPCRVGADIFRIENGVVWDAWQVVEVSVFADEIVITDDSDNTFLSCDIGKTVFLTRAEAESALSESKAGESQ